MATAVAIAVAVTSHPSGPSASGLPDQSRCDAATAIEANFDGKRGPYPITVDASGIAEGLQLAIRSTDLEGVCVSPVYYPGDGTPLPMGRMYTKGIRLETGRCHARVVIPAVAEATARGRLHPDVIANRRVAWRDAAAAMAEPAVKLVVERAL